MNKDKKIIIANVLALSMGIVWIACSLFVWLLPELSMTIANWWLHGLDVQVMGKWNLTLVNFVMGGLTAAASWFVVFVFGWCWEKLNQS